MEDTKPLSGRKFIALAAFSLAGGVVGLLIARIFGAALETSPAWIGPAILIGSIALLVIGLLLLPVAMRAVKSGSHRRAP